MPYSKVASLARRLFLGPGRRVFWLKEVWAAAFVAGMLLSPRLWVSDRNYPLCPVFDELPEIPYPLDYFWFAGLLGLLAAILIVPRPARLLIAFVGLAGLLSLWDQNRWQPWFYQYLFIGIALACYPWRDPEGQPERRAAALDACRLIIAATYFWSGLQKLNPEFAERIYPGFLQPILAHLPEAVRSVARDCWPAAPVLEALIGIGLLIPRVRLIAVAGAAAMHALILVCLCARNHNSVVWPWNIALPVMTALIFWRVEPLAVKELVWPRRLIHWVALLLFGILPALNFFDLWDSYLSASLYSGSTPKAYLFVRPGVRDRVPDALRDTLIRADEHSYWVDFYDWSMKEMNVPHYPALRVYQAIARRYLPYAAEPAEVLLDYWSRPDVLTGKRQLTQYYGQQLQGTP